MIARGEFPAPVKISGRRVAWPLSTVNAWIQSRIESVSHKSGRTGDLVFVGVKHEITNAQGLAISEEHDIVYRAAAQPGDPAPPPALELKIADTQAELEAVKEYAAHLGTDAIVCRHWAEGSAGARAARARKVPYVISPRGMLVPELMRRKSRWAKAAA